MNQMCIIYEKSIILLIILFIVNICATNASQMKDKQMTDSATDSTSDSTSDSTTDSTTHLNLNLNPNQSHFSVSTHFIDNSSQNSIHNSVDNNINDNNNNIDMNGIERHIKPQMNEELNNGIDVNIDITDQMVDSNETKLEVLTPNVTPIGDSLNTNSTNITINMNNESKVNCTPIATNSTHNETLSSSLILVNSTRLADYLESQPNISQNIGAQCVVVIFYYSWCPFSAKSAKHFNALARVYPQFHVLAINAYGLNSLNMRYGLVGVPSLLFFHNGKIVGKLNDSEPTIEGFVNYIHLLTGLSPVMAHNITEEDLLGPLSSTPQPKFDYLLLFSWLFCLSCFSYLFGKSNLFKTIVETVRNNWREAEAQHEHID